MLRKKRPYCANDRRAAESAGLDGAHVLHVKDLTSLREDLGRAEHANRAKS